MAHQLRARRCAFYASADDMAAEAPAASARVVRLCRRQRLCHNRGARLAGPRYRKPLCLSVAWSNRISLLLLSVGRSVKPTQRHPGPRHRAHLRLCGFHGHIRLRANLRCTWGSASSKSSGRSSCAFGYRCSYGALPSESSSRRRNYAHRGSRDHLPAKRTCRHRDRSDPACRPGLGHQSGRRDSLSPVAKGIDLTQAYGHFREVRANRKLSQGQKSASGRSPLISCKPFSG